MKKKTLVGFGNTHATKMVFSRVFSRIYPFYYEQLSIPLILKKPHATCCRKLKITIQELPKRRRSR